MYVAAADNITNSVQMKAVSILYWLRTPVAHGVKVHDTFVRRCLIQFVEQLVIRKCTRLNDNMVKGLM